jgi:hypothetical protein
MGNGKEGKTAEPRGLAVRFAWINPRPASSQWADILIAQTGEDFNVPIRKAAWRDTDKSFQGERQNDLKNDQKPPFT